MAEEECAKAAACTVKLVTIDDQPKKERRYRAAISTPFWIDQFGNRLADGGPEDRKLFDDVMVAAEGDVMHRSNRAVIGAATAYLGGMIKLDQVAEYIKDNSRIKISAWDENPA